MPRGDGVGVSTRIEDEGERTRLKTVITANMRSPDSGGYIVRTAAAGVSADSLAEDMAYLDKLWTQIGTHATQDCDHREHALAGQRRLHRAHRCRRRFGGQPCRRHGLPRQALDSDRNARDSRL